MDIFNSRFCFFYIKTSICINKNLTDIPTLEYVYSNITLDTTWLYIKSVTIQVTIEIMNKNTDSKLFDICFFYHKLI